MSIIPTKITPAIGCPPRPIRPTADQPGTLGQQLDSIALYLVDPSRRHDPRGAWQAARRLVMPHARRRAA